MCDSKPIVSRIITITLTAWTCSQRKNGVCSRQSQWRDHVFCHSLCLWGSVLCLTLKKYEVASGAGDCQFWTRLTQFEPATGGRATANLHPCKINVNLMQTLNTWPSHAMLVSLHEYTAAQKDFLAWSSALYNKIKRSVCNSTFIKLQISGTG